MSRAPAATGRDDVHASALRPDARRETATFLRRLSQTAAWVGAASWALLPPFPALAATVAASPPPAVQQQVYRGMCDASGAVALDDRRFVVADDERNTLLVYRVGVPEPVDRLDVAEVLGTAEDDESDLEGAARIGTRTYWISSHGRTKKGKVQERRFRLFATEQDGPTMVPPLKVTGRAYRGLLDDLLAAPSLASLPLAAAVVLPPDQTGGFNIEGLATTPDGALLIGLRNPVPGGQTLVLPLLNPAAVVERGEHARFGPPAMLALGGRGIRSIEADTAGGYLVVAGPIAADGPFALYRWAGPGATATEVPTATSTRTSGRSVP